MSTQILRELACPEATTLRLFLNDESLEMDGDLLRQHIDACPACQAALAQMVGGTPNLPGLWQDEATESPGMTSSLIPHPFLGSLSA